MSHIDPSLDLSDLVRLYAAEGWSENKVAKFYGISRCAVRKRLVKANITPRLLGDAVRLFLTTTTPEQRMRKVQAAHAAVRGKTQSEKHRCLVAATLERNPHNVGRSEGILNQMLSERGIETVSQKAIGRYNVDMADTVGSVAVEVFGGGWHASGTHHARLPKRLKYIRNRGWAVCIVWDRGFLRGRLSTGAADKIAAYCKARRANKATAGKELVILGNGDDAPRTRAYGYNAAGVPGPKRGHKVRR